MKKIQYDPKLSHKEVSAAISKLGIKKANTKVWQLLLLGTIAGLYIGIGGNLFLAALAEGAGKVVGGMLFSLGLILVLIAGAELFTGNITMIVGTLGKVIPVPRLLKNLSVVYIGNLIGSLLFCYLGYVSGLFGKGEELTKIGTVAVTVSEYKIAIPFFEGMIRGVLCNILVILAIILSYFAKDVMSKILCCIFPVTAFIVCGFEHCVANMYLIPLGLVLKGASFSEFIVMFVNIVPVTIGNIIGGVFILIVHPNRIRQLGSFFNNKNSGVRI
jgi:formate/nitrite transporter